jgi:hypothetical protein
VIGILVTIAAWHFTVSQACVKKHGRIDDGLLVVKYGVRLEHECMTVNTLLYVTCNSKVSDLLQSNLTLSIIFPKKERFLIFCFLFVFLKNMRR